MSNKKLVEMTKPIIFVVNACNGGDAGTTVYRILSGNNTDNCVGGDVKITLCFRVFSLIFFL
jgi:hypothetical protein